MSRKTIALIGGGQIGGNLALLAAQKELGNIIIFDIPKAEGMVKGKALDLMQLRPHDGYDANITGTSNWKDVKDADVFIITAGIPRKPGMDREDLLEINLGIMKDVAENIKEQAPQSFVIVISNPLACSFNIDSIGVSEIIRATNTYQPPSINNAIPAMINRSLHVKSG